MDDPGGKADMKIKTILIVSSLLIFMHIAECVNPKFSPADVAKIFCPVVGSEANNNSTAQQDDNQQNAQKIEINYSKKLRIKCKLVFDQNGKSSIEIINGDEIIKALRENK